MKSLRKILVLVFGAAVVITFSIFAFQNSQEISVRFMHFQTPSVPMFIIIFSLFILGILFTGVFCMSELIRLNRKTRRQEKDIKSLEKQLNTMKQQPLLDDFEAKTNDSQLEPKKKRL